MLISSDAFIELFITLKQIEYLNSTKNVNLLSTILIFNTKTLEEFIFLSKKDYRFKEFLSSFNFIDNYSIDLVLALNKAVAKHLLTGIYDMEARVSLYYVNNRILEENCDYYYMMYDFINSFDEYCLDKEEYLKNNKLYMQESLDYLDNTRMVFDLQRRIKNIEDFS